MRVHFVLFAVLCPLSSVLASPLPDFRPSDSPFKEQTRDQTLPNDVLLHTNVSADFDTAKSVHHIIYLLPNGNTIPQTLGRLLTPGEDWHYDIQHIAAQTRFLRKLDSTRNVVLSLLQAPGKSWPKFRADHPNDNPTLIRACVQSAVETIPTKKFAVTLAAHSGGGSFLFGYINSPDPIPTYVSRIVFLDANYSYSDTDHHGDKLLTWLKSSKENHLIVFAYDDRNVTLNGKKIVSDTGGTYRATQRMLDYFTSSGVAASPTTSPVTKPAHPFIHHSLLNGQAQFFLHPNPELKILHTAMIGEMNAYLHALTADTPLEPNPTVLAGPRAYSQFIDPSQSIQTQPSTRAAGVLSAPASLELPARPADAAVGSAVIEKVMPLSIPDREELLIQQVLSGNIPSNLRTLIPITVTAAGLDAQHTATYYVTPDVLAVGSGTDSFRIPLTPMAAQRIATAADCSLITRKISNDIHAHANVRLEPHPLTKDRDFAATFYEHHQIIEAQLKDAPRPGGRPLIAGHKKDVVLTPRHAERPGKVAIYGWHYPTGKPIQPLYLGHVDWYVDYSHGIRLISNHLIVDGKPTTLDKVLPDPNLAALLSDEGPTPAVYPSTAKANPRPGAGVRPTTAPSGGAGDNRR